MREKRTRVLAILLIMMMAFALMPVQTAWANWHDFEIDNIDECPRCQKHFIGVIYNNGSTLIVMCDMCDYFYDIYGEPGLIEPHFGGTATCSAKAVCEGCGGEYLDPNNHVNIVVDAPVAATCTKAGKTEGQHCGDCGKVLEEQTEVKALGHKGGTATCTAKAVCETCGQEYGEVLGHKWGAWTVTKEATTSEEGIETRVCSNDSSHIETRKIAKKEETKKEEPKKEAAKAETVSKTTDTQPQTGDESQTVWVIMMMLSAAVLIVLAVRKRRVFD